MTGDIPNAIVQVDIDEKEKGEQIQFLRRFFD